MRRPEKVFTVIMPLVTPTLIAAALLVFMNCMADFGTPALIGEGYRYAHPGIFRVRGRDRRFHNF